MRGNLSSAAWGLVGVILGAAIVGVGRAQDAGDKVVSAQEFRLVDGAGNVWGEFGVLQGEMPYLSLRHADGRPRIRLLVLPDGAAEIRFGEKNEAPAVVLGTAADGHPSLVLRKGLEKRAVLEVGGNGIAALSLNDDRGLPRTLLAGYAAGEGSLMVLDERGMPVWLAP